MLDTGEQSLAGTGQLHQHVYQRSSLLTIA
jgi:hypothetical protein